MSRWKAFVTRGFPGDAMERLKTEFDVVQKEGWLEPTREEYLEYMKDADVMLLYSDQLDRELLEHAPRLKFLVDNWGSRKGVDEAYCREKGIVVYDGMPGSYDWIVKGVAEVAWGLLIACGRRFREGDELVRHGCWTHSEQSNHQLLGEGMAGRTLGILGAGRIGTAVARRSAGFEMKVLYTDPRANAELDAMGCTQVDLDTLMRESDFVVVCLSAFGDQENQHVIGERELALMKKTASVINVTRGWVMDEKALIRALKEKRIAGAGLEVFEHEPEVDPELKALTNVMMVPHTGGALYRERAHNFDVMVDACIQFKKEYEASHA